MDTDTGNNKSYSGLFSSKEYVNFYSGKSPELHLDKIDANFHTVLDIGCGLGRTIRPFLKRNCEIVGIENDDYAINFLKSDQAFKNVKLIQGRFDSSLVSERKFDIIVAYNSIYHCKCNEMFETIDQLKNLLNEGGHLLLTVKSTEGNNPAIGGGEEIETNTWVKVNMPDGNIPHHFCDETDREKIIKSFAKLIYSEEIKLTWDNFIIVQAKGYYYILEK
ncbi:MAG: class I SAM-dependent methyltransferase [Sedimentisphaerales bacterium]|jgi:cyclopropane fatty-acyl-phospholipid synthase-like methyltransferase